MVAATRNGQAKGKKPAIDPVRLEHLADTVFNALAFREKHIQNTGDSDFARLFGSGGRNAKVSRRLDAECGYPEQHELNSTYYNTLYRRQGLAARVVDIWPDECWATHPDVYEQEKEATTKFEASWNEMVDRALVFHYLHRIDRLSGIGRYGILFLGLNDGGRLDRPPKGIDYFTGKGEWKKRKLLFIRAFDESVVTIVKREENKNNPRFGEPTIYEIVMQDDDSTMPNTSAPDTGDSIRVHWTRIIHVADNRKRSEVYGTPRLESVVNYLHDARKVAGGSAEMFWAGGFPGYAFEESPDMLGGSDVDDDSLKETMEAFNKGLKRYLATRGGKWTSLQPQVANPDKHLQWFIRLICISLHVPIPIFMGQESGQLASTENDSAWRIRCTRRQHRYLEPLLLRPFVDRCITLGCLAKPQTTEDGTYLYIVDWRDLRAISDDAKAGVALKKVQALMSYVTGNANFVMPPRLFYTQIMGFTEEQTDAVMEDLKKNPPKPLIPPAPVVVAPGGKPPGGGRNNIKPARGAVGKPQGTRPKGATSKAQGRPSTSSRRGAKQRKS